LQNGNVADYPLNFPTLVSIWSLQPHQQATGEMAG
jgi:hypothetical protein